MSNIQTAYNTSLWLPYTQMQTIDTPPLQAHKTLGTDIYLSDGRVLTDAIASWWTAAHGYNHPYIISEINAQLNRMAHIMLGGLVHEPAIKLSQTLVQLLPGALKHVFFSDSGSVSVEVALKMAWQYWQNCGHSQKKKIIYFDHAYHGDTVGTMALCDPREGMHTRFNGLLPQHDVHAIPRSEHEWHIFAERIASNKDNIAAVIIEPLIQGAGGMQCHDPSVLRQLRTLCDENDILLIFDEIFTGFWRTGSLFAMMQAMVVPDIVCLSKALTGGMLPLAATVASTDIFQSFLSEDSEDALMHGNTFMGNPLAATAALASLKLFEQSPYMAYVANIEQHLHEQLHPLAQLDVVKEVRIKGAMGAVEFHTIDLPFMRQMAINEGVWLRPFGKILYTTPALTISEAALGKITNTICSIANAWQEQ